MERQETNKDCIISSHSGETRVVQFYGILTYSLLKQLLTELESRLNCSRTNQKVKRKVMNVAIEAFSNVYNHARNECSPIKSSMQVIEENEAYRITTKNPVSNDQVDVLNVKLTELLSYSRAALNKKFLTELNAGVCRPTGAGLGFLDMARRSNQEMDYKLINHGSMQCFQLDIRIRK